MKHQIILQQGEKYPYLCTTCLRTWRYRPSETDPCANKPCYYWQQSPAHLQTFSQLRRAHLKPRSRKEADAYLWCHDAWWALYDSREAMPRRQMTEKQKQAYLAAWPRTQEKYTCAYCQSRPRHLADLKRYFPGVCRWCMDILNELYEREADHTGVVRTAQKILAHPEKYVVLDTETISLYGEPVEIVVIDLSGVVLFNSLIKPKYPVEPDARAVHEITDEELATAPTLAEVWPDLQRALADRSTILTYNAAFDQARINQTARRDGLEELPHTWHCLMEMYAIWYGEWSDYYKNYRWQPLNGGHRALGDALAALNCLKEMAVEAERLSPEEQRIAELEEMKEIVRRQRELCESNQEEG
jgi:DNA polymerase III epsilon subunit-like protein